MKHGKLLCYFSAFVMLGAGACARSTDRNSEDSRNGLKIKIDLSDAKPFMENLSSIEGFRLQEDTEKFPGEVLSASIGDKMFVLVDSFSARGVYGYDYTGRQLFAYDKIGQGPDEMLDVSDVQIVNDSIYVFDNKDNSIITLDSKGNYASRRPAENACSFAMDGRGVWYDHMNFPTANDGYSISYVSEDGRKGCYPIPERLKHVTIGSAHSLLLVGDTVHYMCSMQPLVLECINGEVRPEYEFDFGDRWIPDELCVSGRHPYDIMQDLKNNGYVLDLRLSKSPSETCLSFISGDMMYYYVFNQGNGKSKLLEAPKDEYGHPLGYDKTGRLMMMTRTDTPSVLMCRVSDLQ